VTNTGSSPLNKVALVDALPEGLQHDSGKAELTWDIGTLAPGQSRKIDYVVTPMIEGQLNNKAEARAEGHLVERAECCLTVTKPDLALEKTGPQQQVVTQPATYRITATNPGTGPLTNLVITDLLPAGTTFVSAGNGGRLEGNQVRWTVNTLAPGASHTVEVMLRAQEAGRLCNKATASADRGLSAESEACTEFIGASALLLEVGDDGFDPIEVNGEGCYVITVRNTGSMPVSNVQITTHLPEQLVFSQAKGPANHQQEGQRVTFNKIGLQPGSEAVYEVRARATREGDIRFRVELTADQLDSGMVREDESTTIYVDMPPARLEKPPEAVPADPPAPFPPVAPVEEPATESE
jgi:uncharacterized repeat protein (TIGR01451 family)